MNEFMDPYYLSQKEVDVGVSNLRAMLNNREDMLNDRRGGNHEIFRTIGVRMTDSLSTIRSLLKDMDASVAQVRANPVQFNISEAEIANREAFIARTNQELGEIEAQMNVQSSNQRSLFSVSPLEPLAPVPVTRDENPGGSQGQLLAHQEEQIDKIAQVVSMEKQIGQEIMKAMDEESMMLIDLEHGVETANDAMKVVTNRIKGLIENEGKVPTYLVTVLSLVLILMLWWVA